MATTTMSNIEGALGSVIKNLSEENYDQSFARYRFLFELAQTYSQTPSDLIFDTVWNQIRSRQLPSVMNSWGVSYHTSHLILRFTTDAESDSTLASHSAGLRSRLCASILREFFDNGLGVLHQGRDPSNGYLLEVNLIAHSVNLGYIEETAIRKHILQFLISGTSPPTIYQYPVFALGILLKIAGATFEAYTDSSVVDRCLELLKGYDSGNNVYSQNIKVGELYEECLVGAKTIVGGGNSTAGTGLGGTASTTCVCNQGTRANGHGSGRPHCNSRRRITGTTQQGPRSSGPSVPSTRTCHRPRD